MFAKRISAVRKMLDRLEERARGARQAFEDKVAGKTAENWEALMLTKGEAEVLETTIEGLAKEMLGSTPPKSMWESIHAYAKKNYDHKNDYAENEAEYFRWYLMGIHRTRMFLEYLEGFNEADEKTRQFHSGPRSGSTTESSDRPSRRSVFISYGEPDKGFAIRLNDGLRRAGVLTFFFPVDAPPGAKLHSVMRDGVNRYDRVLLICSRMSLDRRGVANELEETLQRKSREGGKAILIPVTIDDYLFSNWAPQNPGTAQAVRDRVVADFRGAIGDDAAFEHALGRVVAVLM